MLDIEPTVDNYWKLLEDERDSYRSLWRFMLPFLPGVAIGFLGGPDFAVHNPTPEQVAFHVHILVGLMLWALLITGTLGLNMFQTPRLNSITLFR